MPMIRAFLLSLLFAALPALASEPLPNPLVAQRADPHVLRHDGWYYLTATVPEYDRLELRRARSIAGLATAEPKTIWRKKEQGPMSAHIWAPELHYLDGRWFLYVSASEAASIWKLRIYVLENSAENPLEGEWVERGQLDTGWESFALDATVFEHRGARYLVWAQRDLAVKNNTDLYIARMASPTQLATQAVMISRPEFGWEKVRHPVNEAPAALVRDDKVFIAYSAAGTGAEYSLGLLWADAGADLLDAKSWRKSPDPVFVSSAENGIYGPGHNSFVVEPDGSVFNVFHARNYREIKGDPLRDPNRATRVQPVSFTADGMPDFGVPARENRP
jgi:GH43 family beta-xylosidase